MAASRTSSNPQLFRCPTCGAALPDPGDVTSVRCEYCGSTVLVPSEFRRSKEPEGVQFGQPVVINVGGGTMEAGEGQVRTSGSLAGILIVLVLSCIVLGIIGAVLSAAGVFRAAALFGETVKQLPTAGVAAIPGQEEMLTQVAVLVPTGKPTAAPFYTLALQFGAKGIGPGQFDDARGIAIDSSGNLFTAEFQDGRMQKFDPSGKFLTLINLPADDQGYTTVSDIAADYAGRIYVTRRGDILIFDAADGSPAGTIPGHFPDTWYETVVADPSNLLYAFHTSAGELDLIKMDASGQQVYRKPQVTEGLVKKTEISYVHKLAVDGLGNLYMLDSSQNQVYKFDPQGNFIDRFGSKGDGPGLLENAEDLAVDGQGRIYILNQDGIEIFDNNGAPLRLLPDDYDGWAFDIKLDPQGSIYIITNAPAVYKYSIAWSK